MARTPTATPSSPARTSLSSGTSLAYTLPADMASADVFYAHAAVETDDYPYVPGSTPDQLKTVAVVIDRSPEATITITPPAAVTGDSVSLSVTAEGHPGVVGGGDPFEWTVTDPSGEPTNYTGALVNGVTSTRAASGPLISMSGTGTTPSRSRACPTRRPRRRSGSSVRFRRPSPSRRSSPLHNQAITLTSTSAAQTGATLDFDWDVLTTDGILVNELGVL